MADWNDSRSKIQPSARLGFVYFFRTDYVDVYKIGFTESSLSGRHRNLLERLGATRVEAVIMTIDSRMQEAKIFEYALSRADKNKTFAKRRQLRNSELFFLDAAGVEAVKNFMLTEMGPRPYAVGHQGIPLRLDLIRKAITVNRSMLGVEMDIQGLTKIFNRMTALD